MDLLARLAAPAVDLLDRVDAALTAGGAPADHAIWPLVRRVRALPGEFVAGLRAADPAAVRLAARPLRELSESYVDGVDGVPADPGWHGDAAGAFGYRWRSIAGYLAGGPQSMAGELGHTATYLDEVASWLAATRDDVATAVAECLGSTEAVRLRAVPVAAGTGATPPLPGAGLCGTVPEPASASRDAVITAAAAIGTRVLRAAAEAIDQGEALRARWDGRLAELPYRPAPDGPAWSGAADLTLPT
jgi:hypothetical protein